jgi:hypothetical protein
MKTSLQTILSFILLSVGVALAAPTEIDERNAYTNSFNSMASSLMNWYGSLISEEKDTFDKMDSKWERYRTQYPKNIAQIKIISTKMSQLDMAEHYKFIVEAKIIAEKQSQIITETFFFSVPYLKPPVIKNIVREKQESVLPDGDGFDSAQFQTRKFAYAWLAYLDGTQGMESTLNLKQWLNSASYSIKMGNIDEKNSVAKTLENRKNYLTVGGHLLHSLKVEKVENKTNTFVLDLIVEWKGVNQSIKPVLAKIHQQIEYQIKNNLWHVISIKETHVLPDIAPWMGFLC